MGFRAVVRRPQPVQGTQPVCRYSRRNLSTYTNCNITGYLAAPLTNGSRITSSGQNWLDTGFLPLLVTEPVVSNKVSVFMPNILAKECKFSVSTPCGRRGAMKPVWQIFFFVRSQLLLLTGYNPENRVHCVIFTGICCNCSFWLNTSNYSK